MKTHQLTTAIVNEPGKLPADRKKSKRMPRVLFASDISATGSRTGWPPTSHEMLNNRLLPAVSRVQSACKDINFLKGK